MKAGMKAFMFCQVMGDPITITLSPQAWAGGWAGGGLVFPPHRHS